MGYSPWSHKELDMTELLHFLSFNAHGNLSLVELWRGPEGRKDKVPHLNL